MSRVLQADHHSAAENVQDEDKCSKIIFTFVSAAEPWPSAHDDAGNWVLQGLPPFAVWLR